ncbi:hypothetical protein [Lacrimispora sp. JR3]|uniref:hypothetical protein n=1 Tax=Lacrimispora sinapis TaxID=3111456 RepID=UPI00374868CC
MKLKNRKIYLSMAILTLCVLPFPVNTSAQTVQEKSVSVELTSSITDSSDAHLYAPIIGWRYKSVNGKVYRRQYNYSREKWIGEWELCP